LGFLFGDGKECLEIVKGSLRSLVLFDMGYWWLGDGGIGLIL
jgi:hypothetical protein